MTNEFPELLEAGYEIRPIDHGVSVARFTADDIAEAWEAGGPIGARYAAGVLVDGRVFSLVESERVIYVASTRELVERFAGVVSEAIDDDGDGR